MKPLRITLFVIAFVALASQTFRHAYVRWLEPRASVLDKYNTQTEKQITTAKSLDELVALYDAAHAKVEQEKAKTAQTEKDEMHRINADIEPYKSESTLKRAINEWEEKAKELTELWRFWLAGVVAFFVGVWMMRRSDGWIGVSLVILAFSEMVWATSPSFRSFGGAQPEFDRLLVHKFGLSLSSLALLLFAWFAVLRPQTQRAGGPVPLQNP